MKRLGKYSGKVYNSNEINSMDECGIMITDEQAADKEVISKIHINNFIHCAYCLGCPTAKNIIGD